jgi:hypothetical protein
MTIVVQHRCQTEIKVHKIDDNRHEGLSQNESDTENNDKSDQTKRMANIAIQ